MRLFLLIVSRIPKPFISNRYWQVASRQSSLRQRPAGLYISENIKPMAHVRGLTFSKLHERNPCVRIVSTASANNSKLAGCFGRKPYLMRCWHLTELFLGR